MNSRTVIKILLSIFVLTLGGIFYTSKIYLKRFQFDPATVLAVPELPAGVRAEKGYRTPDGVFFNLFSDEEKTTITVVVGASRAGEDYPTSGSQLLERLAVVARSGDDRKQHPFPIRYAGAQFDPLRAFNAVSKDIEVGSERRSVVQMQTQAKVHYLLAAFVHDSHPVAVIATRNDRAVRAELIERLSKNVFPLREIPFQQTGK